MMEPAAVEAVPVAKRVRVAIGKGFRALIVLALCVGFLGLYQTERSACHQRQSDYDGRFTYTAFLADEIGATPKQKAKVLADVRKVFGERPTCSITGL